MSGLPPASRSARRYCLLLAALVPLLLTACGDDPAGPELSGDNLFELVTASEDLDLLEDIVGEISLTLTLRTGSDLTFFAPTDEALLSLGTEMLGRLRVPANREILEKLVRRHLVPGRFRLTDLRDGMMLETLEGPPLEVRVEGEDITVGGALVTDGDFETTNGVLHEVDEVVRDHLTLAERLRVTPLVTAFADALDTADLTDVVASGEPYTLFIPINSAFDALGSPALQSLLSNANRDVLRKVLRHHVLPGRVRIGEVQAGTDLAPLDGTPLTVESEDGRLYVGGARVIVPEVETSDGLIYLLDEVVLRHLDLADRIQIASQLSTSNAILRDSGVLDLLRTADGPYTVFAPLDSDWAPLGLAFLPELRARPDLLLRTGQYLVAQGRLDRDALLEGTPLTTLGGYEIPILLRQDVGTTDVFVGTRGRVAFPPREASNGLLYTVSPFNYPPELDLEERAVFTALYRFLNLTERAGLTSLLQEEGPYTVFAPTDDALEGVGISNAIVADVFRYHVVPGRYTASDLMDGQLLPTLLGPELEVSVVSGPNGGTFVNGTRIVQANGTATNGVLHALSGVLMPPAE